jgi:uncharacterized membrane protein YkvA (DUF1232 family)
MLFRIRRLLKLLGRNAIVLWYVCRHRSTPGLIKIAAVLLVVYAISPIDAIPDWIPVLGWLDDVTILAFGIPLILRQVPLEVLDEAQASASGFFSRMFLRAGKKR